MSAKDLVLNIAVNLGRIARFAAEGRQRRADQFIEETERFLEELERAPKDTRFIKTLESFRRQFEALKKDTRRDEAWAERALTWGSILTHRAKLA